MGLDKVIFFNIRLKRYIDDVISNKG